MNKNIIKYIEENTIKCDISYRGGSLVIDMSNFFTDDSLEAIEEAGDEATAGCFQNYLGGGITGSIQIGNNFNPETLVGKDIKKWEEFKKVVIEYFYNLNQGGGDEYMVENVNTLEHVQGREASAY